jgi:hypothetical protein
MSRCPIVPCHFLSYAPTCGTRTVSSAANVKQPVHVIDSRLGWNNDRLCCYCSPCPHFRLTLVQGFGRIMLANQDIYRTCRDCFPRSACIILKPALVSLIPRYCRVLATKHQRAKLATGQIEISLYYLGSQANKLPLPDFIPW